MAHPDHDQVIGSLVAARLRGAAARDTARIEPCPDAETWAAYVDGGLVPAEASHVEAHLAACATCRRLVAALVPESATVEAPVDAPVASGAAVVLPFPRRQVWTWMAAAAGVLMAVTLWSVSRLSQTPELQTADSAPAMTPPAEQPPAAPAPTAAAPAGGATAPAGPAAERVRGFARTEPAKPAAPADDRDRRSNTTGSDASTLAKSTAPAAGREAQAKIAQEQGQSTAAEVKRADAARQQVNVQVNVARPHGPLAAANQQAANQQTAAATPPPAAAAPAAPAPAPAAAPAPVSAPSPPPPAVADAVAGRRAAGLAAARPARAVAAPDNERKEEKDKADAAAAPGAVGGLAETVTTTGTGPVLPAFAEPGGRLRWRIADNGRRIESSSDGGTTWNRRYSAKRGERLRAGSAPDIDSAWVVGDRGLVLRRAVPGEWQAVTRVENVALVAVSASGATAARVTAADGRVFETRDGGATWTPAGAGASPP